MLPPNPHLLNSYICQGDLDNFHLQSLVSNAAMNTAVPTDTGLPAFNSSGYHRVILDLTFLRSSYTIFHSGCIILQWLYNSLFEDVISFIGEVRTEASLWYKQCCESNSRPQISESNAPSRLPSPGYFFFFFIKFLLIKVRQLQKVWRQKCRKERLGGQWIP